MATARIKSRCKVKTCIFTRFQVEFVQFVFLTAFVLFFHFLCPYQLIVPQLKVMNKVSYILRVLFLFILSLSSKETCLDLVFVFTKEGSLDFEGFCGRLKIWREFRDFPGKFGFFWFQAKVTRLGFATTLVDT